MDGNTLADYLTLFQTYPMLFLNPDKEGYVILLKEDEILEVEALVAQRLRRKKLPIEWAKVGIVYRGREGLILRDAVHFPNGFRHTYIRFVNVESIPGVAVLPLHQGNVLLVRLFHHATRNWHLQIPRRYGVKSLSAQENAHRMLIDELGLVASHFISLGQIQPGAGLSVDHDELFLAQIETSEIFFASTTLSEHFFVSLVEFERLICESTITDGCTIAAYAQAKLQGFC